MRDGLLLGLASVIELVAVDANVEVVRVVEVRLEQLEVPVIDVEVGLHQ